MIVVSPPTGFLSLRTEQPTVVVTQQYVWTYAAPVDSFRVIDAPVTHIRGPPEVA